MKKQLVTVAAALCAVALAVWLVASRSSGDAPSGLPLRTPTERARDRPREEAAARLRMMQTESASLMPDDVPGVFLGLARMELVRVRPNVQQGRGAPPGQVLYQEVLGNGAAVVYMVAARLDRVAQVQFLSRLREPALLVEHYRHLRARYGDPTALFDCPQNGDTAPSRRILWIGREVTVMEAILVHPGGVALTLAVAGNADVEGAMRTNDCRIVTRQSLADWPIATELRGERVPLHQ